MKLKKLIFENTTLQKLFLIQFVDNIFNESYLKPFCK